MIFVTLMLPIEVRIIPTFKVAASLHLLNSYPGLILPLIASATATFLFRQFYLTIPDELAEAARIDGAGPLRFFWDVLLPLSKTNMAALFVILFILGWNQYLWPLLITSDGEHVHGGDRHQAHDSRAAMPPANGTSSWPPRCWRCCRRRSWSCSCRNGS